MVLSGVLHFESHRRHFHYFPQDDYIRKTSDEFNFYIPFFPLGDVALTVASSNGWLLIGEDANWMQSEERFWVRCSIPWWLVCAALMGLNLACWWPVWRRKRLTASPDP